MTLGPLPLVDQRRIATKSAEIDLMRSIIKAQETYELTELELLIAVTTVLSEHVRVYARTVES